MAAPAQLSRELTGLDHAHLIAVLLLEQPDGPEVVGLAPRHHPRGHRGVLGHAGVHLPLDLGEHLGLDPAAVREVEAQLVRAHVRSGLPHALTQGAAQRPVEDVGGGVVGLRGVTPGGVNPRGHLGALGQVPVQRNAQHLVVADAEDIAHLGVPGVAVDPALIGHLPAALRVERRLGDLHQGRAIALVLHGQHGGDHLKAVVPHEGRGRTARGERLGSRAVRPGTAAPGGPGTVALLAHEPLESLLIHLHAALLRGITGEVQREAVGVVQAEGVVPRDDPALRGALDHLAQQARALLERAGELLGLRADRVGHLRLLGAELGVAVPVAIGDHVHQPREALGREPQVRPLADRAPDDAAQDVVAPLVARAHTVGGKERHGAPVVGQHAHRPIHARVGAVSAPGCLLGPGDERPEAIGLEDRLLALQDGGQALEPRPGVDVLRGQGAERPVCRAVVLHEHEVPILQEAVRAGDRSALGAESGSAVEVQLGVGAARPGGARLPEVVLLPQALNAIPGDAHLHPLLEGLIVGRNAVHALEHRDPDLLGVEAQHLRGELEAEADGVILEVVADREVPEHLEEGQVPGRAPHLVDVERAEALLRAGHARRGRPSLAKEVRLQGLHAGDGQQHGGVVLVGDERGRGDPQVPLALEVAEEALPDLGGRHAGQCTAVSGVGTRETPRRQHSRGNRGSPARRTPPGRQAAPPSDGVR